MKIKNILKLTYHKEEDTQIEVTTRKEGFPCNPLFQIITRKKIQLHNLIHYNHYFFKPIRYAHWSNAEALLSGERDKCPAIIASKNADCFKNADC